MSYGLLKFYVPRRIGFALARPAFEQWLTEHPDKLAEGRQIGAKFGIYHVELAISGDWNDTYFQTHQHGGGLGPDTVSYGFAHQPNFHQSPLGSAYYRVYPLGGKWYWFRASNDW